MATNTNSRGRKRPDPDCPICRGAGLLVRRDVTDPRRGELVQCSCTQDVAEVNQPSARVPQQLSLPKPGRAMSEQSSPAAAVRVFSAKKIATFLQCPLRFKLKYVDGEKTDDARERDLIVGSIVHATLHQFMSSKPEERCPETLKAQLDDCWPGYWESLPSTKGEEDRWRARAWRALREFLSSQYSQGEPAILERHFRIALGEYTIKGVIDRIDRVGPREYEVIDYKTFEPRMTEAEALEHPQTVLYYFGAERLCGVPPGKATYLFLEQGTRTSVQLDAREMEAARSRTRTLIDQIRRRPRFEPRMNRLCRNCTMRGRCEAAESRP